MKKSITLSKSRILSGIQCHKLLWLSLHQSDLARPVTAAEQARFDVGHEVGAKAQQVFPDGVLIDVPHYDRMGAVSQTQKALDEGAHTIYEAAVEHDGLWAKIDILHYRRQAWDLIEVKSTTSVKDQHILDVAIQAYILMHQGLPMGKCYLMHLNKECRYPNLKNLFVLEDITDEVEALVPEVQAIAEELKKVATLDAAPQVEIGPHCHDPYDCPFVDQCWKSFPKDNVFDLPGVGAAKAWGLVDSGIKKIKDLDEDDFKGLTRRAIEVVKTGKSYLDKKSIQQELKNWEWPLYFFDFETLGDAIPRFNGVGPYNNIPFQYSCHVWESPKSKELKHFEYLHTDGSDPRPALVKSIIENFGPTGSVVAYNKAFEKGVLQNLAEEFPKHRKALNSIMDRLVDPLPIFRNHVYQKGFQGSFSIKTVAPTILGDSLSYEGLEVADGSQAQVVAGAIMRGLIVDPEEREKLIGALLEYCWQDTLAMVELVDWLVKQ